MFRACLSVRAASSPTSAVMPTETSPAHIASLREENKRLHRVVEELSVLNSISGAISSTVSLNEIVEMIVQESVKYFNVEQGAVLLLRDEKDDDPFRTIARKAYSGSGLGALSLWPAAHRLDA